MKAETLSLPEPAAQRPALKGADAIARTLEALGVTTMFCYPGGGNLEILDALSRVNIELVRTEHEQGAVFAAQGYARATGKLGVCLATAGPGATNLVTGIADANSDSIPVLALTGNVATRWLGKNAFQEVDIVAITRPITKLARQVRATAAIEPALREAARLALDGRCGPVLLDFPKDVQQAPLEGPESGPQANEAGAAPASGQMLGPEDLDAIGRLLARSKKPVIYAGGGVIASGTSGLLIRLAEALRAPVALTMMGLGALPAGHPLLLGPLGMHGAWCANVAVNEADLVLALGVRFDDRVIGAPEAFAAHAAIVHIDIDAREIGKNKPVALGIQADLRAALAQLLAVAAPTDSAAWRAYLGEAADERPLSALPPKAGLSGARAIAMLAARLPADAIACTGVGQHQMWAMQHLAVRGPRRFISSCGFGTMGFGLPAALGAKAAAPDRMVLDIDGDGSLNMTINELSTCHRARLGVKVFVVNNQWLGMVRQWQDLIYAGNRVISALADESGGARAPYPDFLAIARGYGIRSERCASAAELDAAIGRMVADPAEPYLLDVVVTPEANVYPMIPAGRTYRDVLFDPALGYKWPRAAGLAVEQRG